MTAWPLNYLMVNGYGDPDTNPDFPAGIEALYTASYTLKFMLKKELETRLGGAAPGGPLVDAHGRLRPGPPRRLALDPDDPAAA